MTIKPVPTETLEEIRTTLGLESFARPWAVMIDTGDFGTVFSYLPLSAEEYGNLPPKLQSHAYRIDKGRYGLVGFVPKGFQIPREGRVTSVSAEYSETGRILKLSYTIDTTDRVFCVENSVRRETLMEHSKKKKIPIRTVVRSGSF